MKLPNEFTIELPNAFTIEIKRETDHWSASSSVLTNRVREHDPFAVLQHIRTLLALKCGLCPMDTGEMRDHHCFHSATGNRNPICCECGTSDE